MNEANIVKRTYDIAAVKDFVIEKIKLLPLELPENVILFLTARLFEKLAKDLTDSNMFSTETAYRLFSLRYRSYEIIFFDALKNFMDSCDNCFKNRKNYSFERIFLDKPIPRKKADKALLEKHQELFFVTINWWLYFGILKFFFEDINGIENLYEKN